MEDEEFITLAEFYKYQYHTVLGCVFGCLGLMYIMVSTPAPEDLQRFILMFIKIYTGMLLVYMLSNIWTARYVKNNPPPENIDE